MNRGGRDAAPSHARQRRHARVVPAVHDAGVHQFLQLALAGDGVRQLQARELYLLRVVHAERLEKPVVERAVVLEFQRAQRMGDALDRVRQAVREVVGGVDAPAVAAAVVRGVADAVNRRVAHVDVGRGHVDLCAQHMFAVGELAVAHAPEQIQVLFHAALAEGAVGARFGQRAAVAADVVGAEAAHIRLARAYQFNGAVVELAEVVRCVEQLVPLKAEPAHILDDGLGVLGAFLLRVGVVEAQVAKPAVFAREAEIQADGLGVADMQVAVRLRRKARDEFAAVLVGGEVALDNLADEVGLRFVRRRFHAHTIRRSTPAPSSHWCLNAAAACTAASAATP